MDQGKYKLLAQAMLQALANDSNDDHPQQVNFPELPAAVYSAQFAIMQALHQDGFLIGEQANCSYVEPGCLEHNIVHIDVSDGTQHIGWVFIDPETGEVGRL